MNFVDSNILIYAFGQDQESEKPAVAQKLLGKGGSAFSIQVFQEFYFQTTHQRRADPLSFDEALEVVRSLSAFPVQENTLNLFEKAVAVQQKHRTSFWDANILAAAQLLKCTQLYSEDLNHGQHYGSVQVVNPFVDLS